MKKLIQITFIIMSICSYHLNAQWITPKPQGNMLLASVCVEEKAYFLGQSSSLLITSDGGETWEVNAPYSKPIERGWYPDHPKQLIAFADTMHGFIAMSKVYLTSDGGNHWIPGGIPNGYGPIYFATSRHGWKYGYTGFVKTTDAGVTWNTISSPLQSGTILTAIEATDSLNVWIVINDYQNYKLGAIKHSSDGGGSWSKQTIQWGFLSDTTRRFMFVDFKMRPSGIGLACGYSWPSNQEGSINFLIRTTNFGTTWTLVQQTNAYTKSIVSVSDSLWIVLGNRPRDPGTYFGPYILRSNDSGFTWTMVYQNYDLPAPQTGVWIPKKKIILAGGYRGVLYRSTDLGITWKMIGTRNVKINDVDFARGTNAGFAAGDSSTILHSKDNGESWSSKNISHYRSRNLLSISAQETYVWAGGDSGLLLRSNDNGETWNQIHLQYDTLTYSHYAITDVSSWNGEVTALALTGLFWVFDKSFIHITTNGGSNWSMKSLPTTLQATTIHMISDNSIVTGGLFWPPGGYSAEGFVAITNDLGKNWDTTHLPAPVVKVVMINDSLGFAGTYGGCYRTRNGWRTWQKVFTTYEGVSEIIFLDNGKGWLVRGYDLLSTIDFGETWFTDPNELLGESRVQEFAISSTGKLFYTTTDGAFLFTTHPIITSIDSPFSNEQETKSSEFAIHQNYPNPFNPTTTFQFSLPKSSHITLKVFDLLGREIREILSGKLNAGLHTAHWDASGFSSGIYVFQLASGDNSVFKKVVLVK